MIELQQALDAYIHGGTLPDGTAPTYSSYIPGTATTGLTRQVATPTEPFGFGADLSCFDDFTSDFQMVDPTSTLAVLQSNYRRLNTQLGFLDLIGEPSGFGYDIRSLLQKGMTPGEIRLHQDMIQAQILDGDDRNLTCTCVITLTEGKSDELDIELTGSTASGHYSLTMALTDGDLLIKAMQADGKNYG